MGKFVLAGSTKAKDEEKQEKKTTATPLFLPVSTKAKDADKEEKATGGRIVIAENKSGGRFVLTEDNKTGGIISRARQEKENPYLAALEAAQERRVGLAKDSRYSEVERAENQKANRETVKNLYLAALDEAADKADREKVRRAMLTGGRSIDNSDKVGQQLREIFGGVKDSQEVQTQRALASKLGQGPNWESRGGAVAGAIESAVAGLAGGYANALGTVLKNSEKQGLAVDSGKVQKQATGQEWYNRAGTALQKEADKAQRISEEAYARGSEGLGTAQKLLFDAGVSGMQMLADLGVGSLTGGSSLVPMAVRVFGSGAQEARQAGASENRQAAYGAVSAAVEVFTEKMFDGLAGIYGKGAADEIVDAFAKKISKTAAGRAFVKYLAEAGGEGLEEIVSGIVQPALQSIYNGKSVGENYGEMDMAELLYEGAVGALLGGIGGAVNFPASYREEATQIAERYAEAAEKHGADSQEAQTALKEYQNLGLWANIAEKLNEPARKRQAAEKAKQQAQKQTESAAPVEGAAQEDILEKLLGESGRATVEQQEAFIRQYGEDTYNREVVSAMESGRITSDSEGNLFRAQQEAPKAAQAAPAAAQTAAETERQETRAPGYYGDMQGEGAQYIDALAKASGTVIERATLPSGENGYYINGKAVLAEDAGVEIAVHEVTHHLKQAAPEQYRAYLSYVENVLQEEGSLEDSIARVIEKYAEHDQQLTREEALDEMAADYARQLLKDEKAARRLAGEKPSLARRILDGLRELLRKIRAAFGGESVEARQLSEATRLWEDAVRAAGQNTKPVESGEMRHSYAGKKAKTADRESKAKAREMEVMQEDDETIRKETGWFRGADRQWRFEIDDSGMKYNSTGDAGDATLEDIIDHPALFDAYPQLRGVKVRFEEMEGGTKGRYNPERNTITISEELRRAPEKTLLHEIQHAIQEIEGFASGSSTLYWAALDAETGEVKKRLRMERSDTFGSLSREEQNKYTRYKELERELERLADAEDGTEDGDRYLRYDRESDELYLEMYGQPWFQKLSTLDRKLESGMGEEYNKLYRNTAGEIEARDTEARRTMTQEQRRATPPDTGNENTVFAEGSGYFSMSADEQAGIRQQLRANQDRLNAMKVVGTVNTREYAGLDTRKAREKLVAEMKKTGYKVDRHGFGEIRFEESEINNSLNYKEKDPSAEDARRTGFLVLQSVLKRGIEIEGHDMHKGRNYDTVTIAAPVEINGKRGNMAVVVKRTKGNRYKVHRILTPEGETFTMPEMANAEVNTVGAVTNNSQSLGGSTPAINSASENSIPDSSEKSNTDYSQKSQKSIEGTAEAVEEVRRLTRQNKRLEKLNRELKDQLRVAKASGAVTDRAAVKTQAKEILRSYGSKYDAEKMTDMMVKLYDSMANGKLSSREMNDRAREIADIVINHVSTQTNPLHDEYSELRASLRGRKISISEEYRADLEHAGGYSELRKRNMGRFILSKDGQSVDAVYEELSEQYPELFPDDIYHPADQLIQISNVLDELKAVEGNPFIRETGAKDYLAGDILERFYDTPETAGKQKKEFERQRQRDQAANEQRIQKLKEQHAKEISKIEERHREENRKRRENQTASARRKAVLAGTERLAKKLVNPSDKRHIPAELRETVRAYVSMMNTESGFEWEYQKDGTYKRVQVGSSPYSQTTARTDKARALQAEVRKLESSGTISVDPELQDNLERIAEMGETRVADMSKEQLDTVWETMRAIEKLAENSDRMLGQSRYATISAAANALLEENGDRPDKKTYRGLLRPVDDLVELDMMTPETFFHKMGKAGDELFRQMRRAADRQTVILKEGTDAARKAIEESGLDVKALESETHEFELESGEKLTMTTAQLMELYELWKREQARDHIGLGGIKPGEIKGKGMASISRSRAEKVSMGDLSKMLSTLTEQQKALVDKLQKYMAGDLARYGNETSRAVYGYEKFAEKDYWPIRVNKAETRSDPGKAAQAKTIVGFGMAKATAPKASNGLEIGSFLDTYTKHLGEMATYAAWLGTSENLTRVQNYQFLDAEGNRTGETVKTLFEKIYGKGGEGYFTKLMEDIAQGTKTGSDGTVMDKIVGNTKAAAVGANLRVVLQQPTAILRAMNMIAPKYFSARKGGWEKAVQYAPIAQWKDWGYFEMDTGRSVRGLIVGTETVVEGIREKSMALAGKMDSVGWNIIWNAAEAETADKHPELGKGTEAFYEAVAERFSDVIYRTQVVDSVLNRSQIMRKGGLNKLATSFMSEPTKTYNMVLRDIYDISRAKGPEARTAAKKQLARTSGALVLSFAVNAVAQSIMDAMRDDDREKDYWEKFCENWKENFAENFNPFDYVPYAKDIVSIFSGYDVSRMDMDAIADAKQAMDQLVKAIQGNGSKTVLSAGVDAAAESVAILGLPLANVKRDVLAVLNTLFSEAGMYRMQYELDKALYDIDYSGSRVRWWKLLYAAYKNNQEDYVSIYKDMRKHGIEEEKIKAGMENQMKAEYGVSSVKDLPERWTPPKGK